MSETPSNPSSIGSLVASRRRRLAGTGAGEAPVPRVVDEEPKLRLSARRTAETLIEGWAADPADPERRFVVELCSTGCRSRSRAPNCASPPPARPGRRRMPRLRLRARPGRPALRHAGAGAPRQWRGAGGRADRAARGPGLRALARPAAEACWLGGLELSGWVPRAAPEGPPPRIEARIDDAVVALVRADGWREIERGRRAASRPPSGCACRRSSPTGGSMRWNSSPTASRSPAARSRSSPFPTASPPI